MARDTTRRQQVPTRRVLRLRYQPPYDWEAMLAFLRARAVAGVEVVSETRYARTFSLAGVQGVFSIAPAGGNALALCVQAPSESVLPELVRRAEGLLDLARDARAVCRQLSKDPTLRPLVRRRPGLRVPGAWDASELAIRAVLGQQITVAAATTLSRRLVLRYGEVLAPKIAATFHGLTHVFPSLERLAEADFRALGMPAARASTLASLTSTLLREPALLTAGESLERAVERLTSLSGIGPWTAHYIAMRALREADAFPHPDAALLRAITRLTGGRQTFLTLRDRAMSWRPFRAYAALQLWSSLADDV